ncbi:MAG: hypothetical protein OEZ06_15965 [Myxococcales bacterium]|nr:hypothetical protein [Myxococcales bacterium]
MRTSAHRSPSRGTPRLLALGLLALGCQQLPLACEPLGCSGPPYVAKLLVFSGEVARDRAAKPGAWSRTEKGDGFAIGDGLRTSAGASATLQLRGRGKVTIQERSVVRFKAGAGQAQGLSMQVEVGSIEVEGAELSLETLIGTVQIEAGDHVRVRAGDDGQHLDVLVGELVVEHDGQRVQANAGDELVLDIGGIRIEGDDATEVAVVEVEAPDAGNRAQDAGSDGGAGDAAAGDAVDEGESEPAGPSVAELSIAAGESAAIHDPAPPTRVGIALPACEGHIGLEVRGRRGGFRKAPVGSPERAIVSLERGAHSYRIRCAADRDKRGPIVAKGRIDIRRDAATRQLPKRPPTVTVDADGRRYTVRYQNRLPRVTLRWPDAPKASRYTLELKSGSGRVRKSKLQGPNHSFASGGLGEGVHSFTIRADGGRSASGSVKIAFDNAARTASLTTPANAALARGKPATIAGMAMSGAKVAVDGKPVHTDAEGRFRVELTPDGRHEAVAIKVDSGGRVHYYLRRLSP